MSNSTNIPTPRVAKFLEEHGCGKYILAENHDAAGDDWSHYDIEEFYYLAQQLERENVVLRQALQGMVTVFGKPDQRTDVRALVDEALTQPTTI